MTALLCLVTLLAFINLGLTWAGLRHLRRLAQHLSDLNDMIVMGVVIPPASEQALSGDAC